MNRELRQALERVGWDELYEQHISGMARPTSRGERRCRSPFPDTQDTDPSFFVNVYEGVWRCFSSNRGGDYVLFRAILEAEEFDEAGRAIPDYRAAERRLLVEYGVASAVDPNYVATCRDALWGDQAVQTQIARFKPWNPHTLYSLNVGYDHERSRFTFPIYDYSGQLLNVKLYQPGGQPKLFWLAQMLTGNLVFPYTGRREPTQIVVEGETDVLSLRSLGFAAISGTMGASSPVPDGPWFHGTNIYVWTDEDAPGREAAQVVARTVNEHAQSVRLVTLPDWPGKPNKADASDFIQHLYAQGYSPEAAQRAIIDLLNRSQEIERPHAVFDRTARHVSFAAALSAHNLGERITFEARLTARSERRYALPTRYEITCPAQGHNFCRRCPMRTQWGGRAILTLDPRGADTLKLIQESERSQLNTLKQLHGIAPQCDEPRLRALEALDVEPIVLNETIQTSSNGTQFAQEDQASERLRREAFVLLNGDTRLEEGRDYRFEGFVYPMPKTQQQVFLLDRTRPSIASLEAFTLTPEQVDTLRRTFTPTMGQSPIHSLTAVAQDLERATTLIRGRLDLHLAYRTVWHSILAFPFAQTPVERGWIEALVLGDTRCGKSVAFRRMAEFYGIGRLVDCKIQTVAGIVGSVVTSQATGERYVMPGVLPQEDGRIVAFDEFYAPSARTAPLIEVLSSTRSEGVARITKAANAQFRARVRSIWMGNPGHGRLLREIGLTGVELIGRIIPQPEDVARFDFALTVSQDDVDVSLINAAAPPVTPQYSREASRLLLSWTHSRKPHQVTFTPEAERETFALSRELYERYDPTVPLVEPADQRTRVAKVAVSVAAQCFSTPDGEVLQVEKAHVHAARELFRLWYDKPAMGYDKYSAELRAQRTLRDPAAVSQLWTSTFGGHAHSVARELLSLDEFSERTFGTLAPTQGSFPRNVLQLLYAHHCVRLSQRGKREFYTLTPAFVEWLRNFLVTQ